MRRYKTLFLLVIIFTLSNCKDRNDEFTAYCNKISVIKLPLTITCGLCAKLGSDSLTKKYAFQGAEPVGRLEDDKYVYIIYGYPGDICYPYLYTYNKQGKVLDSLYLHISTCAEDEYLGYSTWSVIHADKSIDMTDTTKYFTVDEAKDTRFLIATVIRKRTYKMDSWGIPKLYNSSKDSTNSHKLIP